METPGFCSSSVPLCSLVLGVLSFANSSAVWGGEFADDFSVNPFAPNDYRIVKSQMAEPYLATRGTAVDLRITAEQEERADFRVVSNDPAVRRLTSRFRFLPSSTFPTDGSARVTLRTEWFNTLQHGGLDDMPERGKLHVTLSAVAQHDGINQVEICAWYLDAVGIRRPAINDMDSVIDGCMNSGWSFDTYREHEALLDYDAEAGEIIYGFDGQRRRESLLADVNLHDARWYARLVNFQATGLTNTAAFRIESIDDLADMRWMLRQGQFGNSPSSYVDDPRRVMSWVSESIRLSSHASAESDPLVYTQLRLLDNPDYIEAKLELLGTSYLGSKGAGADVSIGGIWYSDVREGGIPDGIGNVHAVLTLRTSRQRETPSMVYCLYRKDDTEGGTTGLLNPASEETCITHPADFAFDTPYRFRIRLDREQGLMVFRIGDVRVAVDIVSDVHRSVPNSKWIGVIARQEASSHARVHTVRTSPELGFDALPLSDEPELLEPLGESGSAGDDGVIEEGGATDPAGVSTEGDRLAFDAPGYSSHGGCSLLDSRDLNLLFTLLVISAWLGRRHSVKRRRCTAFNTR